MSWLFHWTRLVTFVKKKLSFGHLCITRVKANGSFINHNFFMQKSVFLLLFIAALKLFAEFNLEID